MDEWLGPGFKLVDKGWGQEKWLWNSGLFCGKILYFNSGKKCSFHYHKIKDETFYLQLGKIVVKYSYEDDIDEAKEITLNPGDIFHVPVGLRHQMIGIEDSELVEFSSTHYEDDSYRILKGD
jgi:mannose-6-phosphate isomerase-like protein (cupin superfamily)